MKAGTAILVIGLLALLGGGGYLLYSSSKSKAPQIPIKQNAPNAPPAAPVQTPSAPPQDPGLVIGQSLIKEGFGFLGKVFGG